MKKELQKYITCRVILCSSKYFHCRSDKSRRWGGFCNSTSVSMALHISEIEGYMEDFKSDFDAFLKRT